jgi:RNA polymerase subunit RPABC4/transcription elongation factor Spt4
MCGHNPLHHVPVYTGHVGVASNPVPRAAYAQPQKVTHPCPQCSAPVQEDFVFCPRCGAEILAACPSCHRAVQTDWTLCPFCGTDLLPEKAEIPTHSHS